MSMMRRVSSRSVTWLLAALGLALVGGATAILMRGVPLRDTRAYDAHARLVSRTGTIEVACPAQSGETAVIVALGQSNIANTAAMRVVTRYPAQVVSLFAGRCMVAASPLLGASGQDGEFLTLLADRLIESGRYRGVVLVPLGVGDSAIARWQDGGDLNGDLKAALAAMPSGYRVTHVLWHHGETDARHGTSAEGYRAAFASLTQTLRSAGVDAPIFLAISTRCGPHWTPENPTALALRSLVADGLARLGADSDRLLTSVDRLPDGCHLSASGQTRTADAYAAAIAAAGRR